MSVRLVANVLDYVHGLPHGTKLLLLCLADYADDSGNCWPSFQSLANRTDMSRRHVIRVMAELETTGLIRRVEERPYKPTVYRLIVPTSDTHVTTTSDTQTTSDRRVTSDTHDTRVVTPASLGSDTHVTTTSDIAMSPNPPINHQRTPNEPPERARAKRATAVPESIEVSDEQYGWAWGELGLQRSDVDRETAKLIDHFRSTGETKKDWGATWRNWMRRSLEFRRSASNGRASPVRDDVVTRNLRNLGVLDDATTNEPVFETTGVIRR